MVYGWCTRGLLSFCVRAKGHLVRYRNGMASAALAARLVWQLAS